MDKVIESIYDDLALNAYHEARGESDRGVKAVCKVVLNRAQKRKMSVHDVIWQKYQFSWTFDSLPDEPADIKALDRCRCLASEAVAEFLNGDNLSFSDHYYATTIHAPYWAKSMRKITQVGRHIFFKS